jgi:hypothetical protein
MWPWASEPTWPDKRGNVKMSQLKVLYIGGSGRSGSTILGNVLGQIDGFVHVGEIYYLWSHGLIHNHLCGCGTPVRECPSWREVFDRAYGGMERVNPYNFISQHKHLFGSRGYPPPLTTMGRRQLAARSRDFVPELSKLYQAIQTVNNARVIVDSSKLHMQALALSMMPDVDLYMLHLLRDSHGIAYSWQKKKLSIGTDKAYMDRYGPWRSSLKWNIRNLYISLLARNPAIHYHLLRYEDFIDHPRAALGQVLDWMGEESDLAFINAQNEVQLSTPQCTIHGNPVRFQTGKAVKLRADDEWKTKINQKDKWIVTLLTAPLLKKYGYALR